MTDLHKKSRFRDKYRAQVDFTDAPIIDINRVDVHQRFVGGTERLKCDRPVIFKDSQEVPVIFYFDYELAAKERLNPRPSLSNRDGVFSNAEIAHVNVEPHGAAENATGGRFALKRDLGEYTKKVEASLGEPIISSEYGYEARWAGWILFSHKHHP